MEKNQEIPTDGTRGDITQGGLRGVHPLVEFHRAFGLPYNNPEELHNYRSVSLRVKLIDEEFHELCIAQDEVELLDAIGDLLYVIYGAGVCFGFNLDITPIGYDITMFKSENFAEDFGKKLRSLTYYILMDNYDAIKMILVEMLCMVKKYGVDKNYNLVKLFAEIHRSNMTKLCSSQKEAVDTVNHYKKYFGDRYPKPIYCKCEQGERWVVFEESTGKRLKSISYSPVIIDPREFRQGGEAPLTPLTPLGDIPTLPPIGDIPK